MLSAIIVAGGSSRRMGFDKTFALINGRPVIAHSIAAFEATPSVVEIILVGREDRVGELLELAAHESFRKVTKVIAGGTHRQDSVANGLQAMRSDAQFVAVHDAARPLVRPEQIEAVVAQARKTGAAALAAPVKDTIKQVDPKFFVSGSVSREGLYAMETPQIFAVDLLRRAYEAVKQNEIVITDEASAVERLGHKVLLVPNEQINLKITFPDDLKLAEMILTGRR
ncbi:MAG: 2-C-methyl-D-erythritol 4-phosphate cytidylyltransferase [Verrucomicrobiota bacterium]|nr:2-C-methyl-D-erythritol 4-phosphate cytidylyltransferase [Verrucomicrobiota bacterium]